MGIVFTLILMAGCIGLAAWSLFRQMYWQDEALRLLYEFSPDLWRLLGEPLGFHWMPPEEIKPGVKNAFKVYNGMQLLTKDRPEFALIPGMKDACKKVQHYNIQSLLLMMTGAFGVPVGALILSNLLR